MHGEGVLVLVSGLDVFLGQRSDPSFDLCREFLHDVGMLGDQVLFLTWVVDDVVRRKFGSVLACRMDELPLTFTDASVAVCGTGFSKQWLGAHMLNVPEP